MAFRMVTTTAVTSRMMSWTHRYMVVQAKSVLYATADMTGERRLLLATNSSALGINTETYM